MFVETWLTRGRQVSGSRGSVTWRPSCFALLPFNAFRLICTPCSPRVEARKISKRQRFRDNSSFLKKAAPAILIFNWSMSSFTFAWCCSDMKLLKAGNEVEVPTEPAAPEPLSIFRKPPFSGVGVFSVFGSLALSPSCESWTSASTFSGLPADRFDFYL